MNNRPKIVVLTPVRNEAWILKRFLAVTSAFADHIIIADQHSTDESRDICKGFQKVWLIENAATEYNEWARQKLLIEEARRRVPSPRILLALDADEILAADGSALQGWSDMLHAAPGTVLWFEKPDLCITTRECNRFYDHYWPLGYVDDGAEHSASLIHSRRVPCTDSSHHLKVHDVKFLHYNMVRPAANMAKRRMYCVIEALAGTKSWVRRMLEYRSGTDWTKQGPLEPCPESWFDGWERMGIDMHTVPQSPFHWQDVEVLGKMKEFGEGRFYHEDIWDFDWEACRRWAVKEGIQNVPNVPIKGPGSLWRMFLKVSHVTLGSLRTSYRLIGRFRSRLRKTG